VTLSTKIEDYWRLTKPRIWGLLVFTGAIAMIVAFKETPVPFSAWTFGEGLVALVLGSAAAEVLTNYHDRDIDGMMKRTMKRALPAGRVSPGGALSFGLTMAVFSVVIPFFVIGSALSAGFMLLGLVDNIIVYSFILKRRSWLNIILGGISGGMPVLVGYAAVSNTVTPIALYMSALVIVWIPTHIWSLAIFNRKDYEAAKVPMLPVVFGDRVASICIAATSGLLAVFSLILVVFRPSLLYAVSATVLGAVVIAYSAKLAVDKKRETAWTLFKLTSPYLTIIFLVLGIAVWF